MFIWEEIKVEKDKRSIREEQALENEGDRRNQLVMCEMLVLMFSDRAPHLHQSLRTVLSSCYTVFPIIFFVRWISFLHRVIET